MPKKARVATKAEVAEWVAEKRVGKHPVGGIQGLYIQIQSSGSACWVLRKTMARTGSTGTRRREMGLGAYPDVSLVAARAAGAAQAAKVRAGVDPIEESAAARRETRHAGGQEARAAQGQQA